MHEEFNQFIQNWQHTTMVWSQISFGIAVLLWIWYYLSLSFKRSLTKKHKYMSAKEIKYLWHGGLALTIAIIFFINGLFVGYETTTYTLLIFKTFITIIIGFAIGYVIYAYLEIYYPFILERRLNRIRFLPRYHPNTGHKLRLLTEDEEDVHLTEEMIQHENIFAYEYDVWIDDETGYKQIETYAGVLHLQICEECNFRTSKEVSQEILKEPTSSTPGEVMNRYKCGNCGHVQDKRGEIPPIAH